MTASTLEVAGRQIRVTNLDRVLWPATGFTKGAMLDYYLAVAPALLPQLGDRPVVLGRFPEGVHERGWGQFECRGRPDWMPTARIALRSGQQRELCVIGDEAALAWVVNQGVIELHPFLARASDFATPTAVVFDLDPGPPAGLAEAGQASVILRRILEADGLVALPKTSGGSGVHVVVPLNSGHSYAETKAYARGVARELAAAHPDLFIERMARNARAGRIFVDWGQNDQRKQTVAAYSLRATLAPSVSTPLSWDDVESTLRSSRAATLAFDPREVLERVARRGDLHRGASELVQRLPARRRSA